MPSRLERVPQREAVAHQARILEARLGKECGEPLGVVATKMADAPVGGPEALLVGGHAQEQPTAGTEELSPEAELALVVLHVLEHLEGADEVEAFVG
jgi:hypothetical protein